MWGSVLNFFFLHWIWARKSQRGDLCIRHLGRIIWLPFIGSQQNGTPSLWQTSQVIQLKTGSFFSLFLFLPFKLGVPKEKCHKSERERWMCDPCIYWTSSLGARSILGVERKSSLSCLVHWNTTMDKKENKPVLSNIIIVCLWLVCCVGIQGTESTLFVWTLVWWEMV